MGEQIALTKHVLQRVHGGELIAAVPLLGTCDGVRELIAINLAHQRIDSCSSSFAAKRNKIRGELCYWFVIWESCTPAGQKSLCSRIVIQNGREIVRNSSVCMQSLEGNHNRVLVQYSHELLEDISACLDTLYVQADRRCRHSVCSCYPFRPADHAGDLCTQLLGL